MKPQLTLFAVLSAVLLNVAHAIMFSKPEPFIITSPNSQATLRHIPNPEGSKSVSIAHRLNQKGELEEVWRASGLNLTKTRTHLSDCGHYLAVCGSAKFLTAPEANGKSKAEALITFLKDGQIFRTHTANDLIKDWSSVEERAAGLMFSFRPSEQTTPDGFANDTFFMTLIDGTCYHFDYTTGDVVGSGVDRDVKSYWDQEKERLKRGRQILQMNDGLQNFEEHFEFSSTEATSASDHPTGRFSHLCNEGPNWRTVMVLKKREANQIVTVHTYIPLTDRHQAILEITPQELLDTISKVGTHPGILAKQQEDGAYGFELFMQGDRFHWNQISLNRALRQSGKKSAESNLTEWVGIYVNDGGYHSREEREYLFLNRKTGELLELKNEE